MELHTVSTTRLQDTINCAILEFGIGGSGDPRRKWEEMGERERERERERYEVRVEGSNQDNQRTPDHLDILIGTS